MDTASHLKQGEKGVWLGLAAYAMLAAGKTFAGWLLGSAALAADGLNNATDMGVSIAILIGLRLSQKPPDHNHPYGHLRAETVASLVVSLVMASVGLQVLLQAGRQLLPGAHPVTPDPAAACIAAAASAVMFGVYLYNRRLANRLHSHALAAAAEDNRSDALVSAGAAIGILGAQAGLPWLDPLAAAVVGTVILRAAWSIFAASTLVLTDGFDDRKLARYRETAENTEGVLAVRQMRARVHGSHVWLDLTVLVDPELNVAEGHRIAEVVEQRLMRKHRVLQAHVHVKPGEPEGEKEAGRAEEAGKTR